MFLKNKNIIFKIRRSKVTDYAALTFIFIVVIDDVTAFLDLQSIRNDEATASKELIFFSALTYVPFTSRKT